MNAKRHLIKGITLEGKTFRPSDWIDRICSLCGKFDSKYRLVYSPHLYPVMVENKRCLIISEELKKHQLDLFNHVMQFVAINQLTCVEYQQDET